MPRTEEENQRIREEQKKHILEAAIRVFARKGFAATKMADIATEANVSYGLAYHYFPNKEQLLTALLERALEIVFTNNEQVLEMPGSPLERLHWLISARLKTLQEHPEFLMTMHQVLIDEALKNKWREIARSNFEQSNEIMRRLIIEGQATGEIAQGDPDQLVATIQACLHGLTFKVKSHGSTQHLPDTSIILRVLKPS